jgi:hypothetical protein
MTAPKNPPTSVTPRTEAGAGASTPTPPESARTGAAGFLPEPGRSTLDLAAEAIDRYHDQPRDEVTHTEHLAAIAAGTRMEFDDCWSYGCYEFRADLRAEKLDELRHEDVGAAALALVLPVLFAAGLVLIAAAQRPNGFTLACLLVLAAVCWWRVSRRSRAQAALFVDAERLAAHEAPAERALKVYAADPWLGTEPDKWPLS